MLILISGSLIYNVVTYDYGLSFWGSENQPYVIGFFAGICALILWYIMWTYNSMKPHLEQKSEKE